MDQDQSVKDARAKLAARFGNTQIGGKGAYPDVYLCWNSMRFFRRLGAFWKFNSTKNTI